MVIISGGQTGADYAGLVVAKNFNLQTTGFAAKNFMTENGPNIKLRDEFNLIDSGLSYTERTILNCKCSDYTLVFVVNPNSPGTKIVVKNCNNHQIINLNRLISAEAKSEKEFQNQLHFIASTIPIDFEILNIAGNRESASRGNVFRLTYSILNMAFTLHRVGSYEGLDGGVSSVDNRYI